MSGRGDLAFLLEVFESMDGVAQTDQRAYICDKLAGEGLKADYALRERISSMAELNSYKEQIRRNMLQKVMGGYVPKGKVPARKVGVIKADGYRIEKWLVQAFPRMYVPVNLYLPDSATACPLILKPNGHTWDGCKHPLYQHIYVNLVKRGYVVVTWDPPGQGERGNYFDTKSGNNHSTAAGQCFLAGISFANFYHYEGVRILDWVIDRDEIALERIGVTGVSGGGSTTAWLMGMDERIKVAAPCMGTVTTQSLMSPIPGVSHHDEDNSIDMALPYGTNFEALLSSFCPKPQLIMAGRQDFTFPHTDLMKLYRHVRRVYKNVKAEKNVSFIVVDECHGYSEGLRKAMYNFFATHLGGEKTVHEFNFVPRPKSQLLCTKTGDVKSNLGSETASTLAYKYFCRHREKYDFGRGVDKILKTQKQIRQNVRRKLRLTNQKIASFDERYKLDLPDNVYTVVRIRLSPDKDRFISGALFLPAHGDDVPVLVVGQTQYANNAQNCFVSACLSEGIGLFYLGLVDCNSRADVSSSFVYMAGKFEAEMKIEDILAGCRYLRTVKTVDKSRIFVAGEGKDAIYALYAAALDESITGCAVSEMIVSLECILKTDSFFENKGYAYDWVLERTKGVALCADVDNLIAALAPRKFLMINPWEGKILSCKGIKARYANAVKVYLRLKSQRNFECRNIRKKDVAGFIVNWARA
ncbi:MAG: alpha/beta hydrolase family protein [Planctomycetota bacterium]